jgi:hypothetical protein
MAIKTDDEDIRNVDFWMEHGGNGDYYINLMEFDKTTLGVSRRIDFRVAMSGGNATHEIKMAIAALWRALEKSGKNSHPSNQK